MKRSILFAFTVLLLCLPDEVNAQLDTIHWMPPLHSRDLTQINDHYIYLSTPETTPFPVNVTDGSGTPIAGSPFIVSNALPVEIYLGTGQLPATKMMIPGDSLNLILQASGLILHGSKEFYANFRARSGLQAGSLTAKGNVARGKVFRAGSMPQNGEHPFRNFVTSIMSTEDNTNIMISEYDDAVVFAGIPAVTADSLSFTLDSGQCIVVSGYTNTISNYQGFVGALIVSDKRIVVNTGNMCGSVAPSASGQDIGIDQIVPIEEIGLEYILIEGGGSSVLERPLVVAHYDGTEVFINGNVTSVTTINAGEWYLIPNSYYAGVLHRNMYVKTSNATYMYQPLAGDVAQTTPGMNFIPPFSCAMPKFVDNIPLVEGIGATTYSGAIIAFTETGSILEVNNIPQLGAETITGLPDWVTYKITGFTGSVSITSTGAMAAGMFGFSGDAGYAGYYSGFGFVPSTTVNVTNLSTTNTELCLGDSMIFEAISQGQVLNYSWDLGDGTLSADSVIGHVYNNTGTFVYTLAVEYECVTDTLSDSVSVLSIPALELGEDVDLCVKSSVEVGVAAQPGVNYLWSTNDTTSQITVNESSQLWLKTYNSACESTDEISVFIPGEFNIPNVFSPNGDNLNDIFEIEWLNECKPFLLKVYNRWGRKLFETDDPANVFWDGKKNDRRVVENGTYFYVLSSPDESYYGSVTVLAD